MPTRIAIIPARGGSKRIPSKNVRDFCGRPMIAHVIDAARASGLFDVIHVSTESEAIRDVVEGLGIAVPFMRPPELADDHTPIMPVLRDVLETYAARGRTFDQAWLLMACSPLVDAADLKGAASAFEAGGGHDPLLAVAEYPAPVEWAFSRGADGRLTPLQPGMFAVRSQDLQKRYFDSGSFVAYPAALVRDSEGAGSDRAFVSYVLGKGKAVDIDDEADWALAEALYSALKHPRPAPSGN